jgi:hypothetical protein
MAREETGMRMRISTVQGLNSIRRALHTHLKPIKAHTRAMVRPATKADISTGDPLAFASAMGYV